MTATIMTILTFSIRQSDKSGRNGNIWKNYSPSNIIRVFSLFFVNFNSFSKLIWHKQSFGYNILSVWFFIFLEILDLASKLPSAIFIHCFLPKGQLISKCQFGIFNSPKNEQNKTFLFVFWENWRHQRDLSKLTDLYL